MYKGEQYTELDTAKKTNEQSLGSAGSGTNTKTAEYEIPPEHENDQNGKPKEKTASYEIPPSDDDNDYTEPDKYEHLSPDITLKASNVRFNALKNKFESSTVESHSSSI